MSNSSTAVDASKEQLVRDFKILVADAEALLKATAGQSGEAVAAMRAKVGESLAVAKVKLTEAEQLALEKAQNRNHVTLLQTRVVFNVLDHRIEPLLNIADYFCWAVQRLFERGEIRYYNFLKDQISLVVDLYDSKNYPNSGNYYTPKKPLTNFNKV